MSENQPIKMSGTYSGDALEFVLAIAEEGINLVNTTTLEFRTKDKALDLSDIVGSTINLMMDVENGPPRDFSGLSHYVADLRPWMWFLTRKNNNRVFQNKSVVDIIMDVIGEYGHSSDIVKELSETYPEREYCVQYRECDLDFLHRLMEEEGIYYYVEHEGGKPSIVLADGPSGHSPIPDPVTLEYHVRDGQYYRHATGLYDLRAREVAQTGKVTLTDYNFEKPKADIKSTSSIATGKHKHKSLEYYDYPGHFRETPLMPLGPARAMCPT